MPYRRRSTWGARTRTYRRYSRSRLTSSRGGLSSRRFGKLRSGRTLRGRKRASGLSSRNFFLNRKTWKIDSTLALPAPAAPGVISGKAAVLGMPASGTGGVAGDAVWVKGRVPFPSKMFHKLQFVNTVGINFNWYFLTGPGIDLPGAYSIQINSLITPVVQPAYSSTPLSAAMDTSYNYIGTMGLIYNLYRVNELYAEFTFCVLQNPDGTNTMEYNEYLCVVFPSEIPVVSTEVPYSGSGVPVYALPPQLPSIAREIVGAQWKLITTPTNQKCTIRYRVRMKDIFASDDSDITWGGIYPSPNQNGGGTNQLEYPDTAAYLNVMVFNMRGSTGPTCIVPAHAVRCDLTFTAKVESYAPFINDPENQWGGPIPPVEPDVADKMKCLEVTDAEWERLVNE